MSLNVDEITTDTVSEATASAGVDFPDGVTTTDVVANSLVKDTADMTINLGHTNASTLSAFELYSNPSQQDEQSGLSLDGGVLRAGDLNILRFNNQCMLHVRIDMFNTPQVVELTFDMPARFHPNQPYTNRQYTNVGAAASIMYVIVGTSNPALTVGMHDIDGSSYNGEGDGGFPNNANLTWSLAYCLDNGT